MAPKNGLHVILPTLGTLFFKSNPVGRHFFQIKPRWMPFLLVFSQSLPRCSGILRMFSQTLPMFLQILPGFSGILPDFYQIKTVGGAPPPASPPPSPPPTPLLRKEHESKYNETELNNRKTEA